MNLHSPHVKFRSKYLLKNCSKPSVCSYCSPDPLEKMNTPQLCHQGLNLSVASPRSLGWISRGGSSVEPELPAKQPHSLESHL